MRARLLVIGPTKPLRGGIPLYTSAMVKRLARSYEVKVVGFQRLYPKGLYPGRSQYEDTSAADGDVPVDYAFDPFDLTSWFRMGQILRRSAYDAILTPWWTTFWTPLYLFIKVFKTAPLVYVCHNFLPHDRHPFDVLAVRLALGVGDAYVAFSGEVAKRLMAVFPGKTVAACRLPSIVTETGIRMLPKAEARRLAGFPEHVRIMLFWGIVRRYKGLDLLLKAMSIMSRNDVQLVVAGEFWEDQHKYSNLVRTLGLGSRVRIIDRYLSTDDASVLLSAGDMVVLPYRRTSQSAVLRLVLDLGIPAVVAGIPGLREQVREGDVVLFHRPDDAMDLARKIEVLCDVAEGSERGWDNPGAGSGDDGWVELELGLGRVLTALWNLRK